MTSRNTDINAEPYSKVAQSGMASSKTVPAGLLAGDRIPPSSDSEMSSGDALPPDAPNASETSCHRRGGSGKGDGARCPQCEGSGRVIESVGGGP